MSMPFLTCAAITAASALISLGFSVAALSNAGGGSRTPALYTVARSMALAVVGVIPFLNTSREWLEAVAVGMVIVQACDAAIGLTLHDRMKTFGPAGTAVANLAALAWLTVQ